MQHGCCPEQGPANLFPSKSHPCLPGQDEDHGVLSSEGNGHPVWARVAPIHPSIGGGMMHPPPHASTSLAHAKLLGRAEQGAGAAESGQRLVPPSPGAGTCPPTLPMARPYSPVPPPEEARGVWRLEGHASA